MNDFYRANPDLARELMVHATEAACDASEAEIESKRQAERLEAAKVLIWKRKNAATLANLYTEIQRQSSTPQTVSELCVHATAALLTRGRR